MNNLVRDPGEEAFLMYNLIMHKMVFFNIQKLCFANS